MPPLRLPVPPQLAAAGDAAVYTVYWIYAKRHRHAAAELAAARALRSQAHMVQGPLRAEALY